MMTDVRYALHFTHDHEGISEGQLANPGLAFGPDFLRCLDLHAFILDDHVRLRSWGSCFEAVRLDGA